MVLKAFLMSTCSTTQSLSSCASQWSTIRWRLMPTNSAAPRTPTPHCLGASPSTSFLRDGVRSKHLPTTLRRVSPTAIGRMPRSFFLSGIKLDAQKKGAALGLRPPNAAFSARLASEICNVDPTPTLSKQSLMCEGRRPLGPGAEPGGNDMVASQAIFAQSRGRSPSSNDGFLSS